MVTFLANEINTTDGDIAGPTTHVQIIFLLKYKNNVGYFGTFFSGTQMNKQSKKVKLYVI